jgi:hypothetical protein
MLKNRSQPGTPELLRFEARGVGHLIRGEKTEPTSTSWNYYASRPTPGPASDVEKTKPTGRVGAFALRSQRAVTLSEVKKRSQLRPAGIPALRGQRRAAFLTLKKRSQPGAPELLRFEARGRSIRGEKTKPTSTTRTLYASKPR